MTHPGEPVVIARALLDAFSTADVDRLRMLLAEDLIAYVTSATGEILEIRGRESYLARVQGMDLRSTDFALDLTQPPVVVDAERVLVMVKISARRGERDLQNFAAHLLRVRNGQVAEWQMVDAKPAESAAFWS
jgi:ketosteroid isomerase-like protein